jgi:hypothetical protein
MLPSKSPVLLWLSLVPTEYAVSAGFWEVEKLLLLEKTLEGGGTDALIRKPDTGNKIKGKIKSRERILLVLNSTNDHHATILVCSRRI